METFQPLINILVLLTILSFAAERGANVLKLWNEDLRNKQKKYADERHREYAMSGRSVLTGIFLALIIKANFFEIITHLDDPWKTIGWVRIFEYNWTLSPALTTWGAFITAIVGSIITGVALGFGNKFWHDILGLVYEVRDKARELKKQAAAQTSKKNTGGN